MAKRERLCAGGGGGAQQLPPKGPPERKERSEGTGQWQLSKEIEIERAEGTEAVGGKKGKERRGGWVPHVAPGTDSFIKKFYSIRPSKLTNDNGRCLLYVLL